MQKASEYAGKISVKKIGEAWWLISPEGEPFISLGINHIDPLFLSGPYNKERILETYGSDWFDHEGNYNYGGEAIGKWLNQVNHDFRSWGFNTYGYYTVVPAEYIKDSAYFIKDIEIVPTGYYERYPDVFSDWYADMVEQQVKHMCDLYRNEKNLLGYALMDIATLEKGIRKAVKYPSTFPKKESRVYAKLLQSQTAAESARYEPIHPCVRTFTRLNMGEAGKKVWIDILQANHHSPSEAGHVYGLVTRTWSELERITEWPEPINRLKASIDNLEMLTRIAEQYYSLVCKTIRKYDPTHLILGDKLNGNNEVPEYLYPVLQKYVDVILIDWDDLFENQKGTLGKIHQMTGKPILLSDSSFSVIKPNQVYAKGYILQSEDEIGPHYYQYLKEALSEPYIVGWHYCGYIEGWKGLDNSRDPLSQVQSGIKDPYEGTNETTITFMRKANSQAREWHGRSLNQ